jgi:hypothetical protein
MDSAHDLGGQHFEGVARRVNITVMYGQRPNLPHTSRAAALMLSWPASAADLLTAISW